MKILSSQNVVLPNGVQPACLVLDKGVIVEITNKVPDQYRGNVQDFGSKVIMPGLVDSHVHINEPGRTEWEGFETATQSAAAGGITTLMDMPLNCLPVTTSKENLEVKIHSLQGKLYVDCGFWGGVTPNSIKDLRGLLDSGVYGVKSFLVDSGIPEFPEMKDQDLKKAIPLLAQSKLPYLIHAEIAEEENQKVDQRYDSFLASRPKSWENNAIKKMIHFAREFNAHVHIVHLSSAEALKDIRKARQQGVHLTVETCPHYLIFSAEEIEDGKTLFKCCPPIREKSNQDLLWQGLVEGDIDFICSDHSPCTANLKKMEQGDFGEAWGGISSLQFSLPLIWTELQKRDLGLEKLVRWLCQKPAEFVGLGTKKGALAQGMDADLVIWDPEEEYTIQAKEILYKNKITPYEGKAVKGRVIETYVRGEKVFSNGKISSIPLGKTLLRSVH